MLEIAPPLTRDAPVGDVKALFLIHALSGGGAERVVARLLTFLEGKAGSDGAYHLAVIRPEFKYDVPAGVPVHVIGSRMGAVGSVLALRRLVRRLQPGAVFSFMPRANLLNLCGKLMVPGWPRAYISERNSLALNYRGRRRVLMSLLLRAYRHADEIVAVSRSVAEEMLDRGIPGDRVTVINNGVSRDELACLAGAERPSSWADSSSPLLVTVGRLSPQKDHLTLLRALKIVRRTCPARLMVFGEGELEGMLRQEADALGLDDAVNWAGFVRNPFPTIAHAVAFVLSSRWEGFPNALLEAMALGKAVVATDAPGGSGELLSDGAGLLVPPGDAEALAGALLRLLQDENLRAELGARAAGKASLYTPEAVFERYRLLIEGEEPTKARVR